MLGFKDVASTTNEKRTERLNFRTSARIKEDIQKAAALAGVDDSAFVMSAAYDKALQTISAHERTDLTEADHTAFFEALDNPPEPTDRLRAAFEAHRKTVVSG